jgi:histidinol phosphatase-like PHP family hydrolase
MDLGARCEFHTHTFFSDGVLSPVELVRRAYVLGDMCIAVTDHVDFTNIEHVLRSQLKLKGNISWDINVLVGVELTHIPVDKISRLCAKARELGAELVVGHGESPVEPVEDGTNRAYIESCVDILAHPGDLSVDDAVAARDNGVYLELTSRRGHDGGNKRVAQAAVEAGAMLLVNTDAHKPEDLISQEKAYDIASSSGLTDELALYVVRDNPRKFLEKVGVLP